MVADVADATNETAGIAETADVIIAAFSAVTNSPAIVAEVTDVTSGTALTAEVIMSAFNSSVKDSATPALATDVTGVGVADVIIAALSVSSNPYAIEADVADATFDTVGTSANVEVMIAAFAASVIDSATPALATEVTGPVAADVIIAALIVSSRSYAIDADVADATLVTTGTADTAEVIMIAFNSSVIFSAVPALATEVTGPVAADVTISDFVSSSRP